jgi:hypothetical protein
MKATPLIIGFAICLLLTVGCSQKPSDDDAKNAIAAIIEMHSKGHIKLIEFKKTAGEAKERFGVKSYHLDYELTIEFTADCIWEHAATWLSFRTDISPPGDQDENVLKRDQRKLTGRLIFERAENKWRIASEPPAPASIVKLERRQQDVMEKLQESIREDLLIKTKALEDARKATKAAEQHLRDLQNMPVPKQIPIFGSAAEAETLIFKEATQQARAILDHDWVEHSDFWFSVITGNGSPYLVQTKELKATLSSDNVTAADRLNGLEWSGFLTINDTVSRYCHNIDDWNRRTWEKWRDGPLLSGLYPLYAYRIQKNEGEWTVKERGYTFKKPLISDIPPLTNSR